MSYEPDKLQKIAVTLMGGLVLLTFTLTNIQAILWQSSDWLVGAVLPSVVVDLTNEERSDVAAAPLRRNSTLDQAAQLKANHMAKNSYFAHYAPDGTSPWYWFDQTGYTYAHAGENLAVHFSDSDEVVEAWMNSPSHRANIVDKKFTEIGVGTAKGTYQGHKTVYVVQLFGTPAAVAAAPATNIANAQAATTPAPAPAPEPIVVEVTNSNVAAAEIDATPVAVEETSPVVVFEELPPIVEETPVAAETEVVTEDSESVSTPVEALPTFTEDIASNPLYAAAPVLESMMATSSGLATADSVVAPEQQQVSFLSLATQPSTVMQVMYTLIALAVFALLILSFVNEMKHAHPVQMAYSVALLLLMVGLYWLHTSLTEGAIVV